MKFVKEQHLEAEHLLVSDNITRKSIRQYLSQVIDNIDALQPKLSQRVARDSLVRQVRLNPKGKPYNHKASLLG